MPISGLGERNLTRRSLRKEVPRLVHLGACRVWAMEKKENWMRIIPEGKDMLLGCAQEHNDAEFLEAIERFEQPTKNRGPGKGK